MKCLKPLRQMGWWADRKEASSRADRHAGSQAGSKADRLAYRLAWVKGSPK